MRRPVAVRSRIQVTLATLSRLAQDHPVPAAYHDVADHDAEGTEDRFDWMPETNASERRRHPDRLKLVVMRQIVPDQTGIGQIDPRHP
jgi:hypothetical protein